MEIWNGGIMVRQRRFQRFSLVFKHLTGKIFGYKPSIDNPVAHHSIIPVFQHSNWNKSCGFEGLSY